MKLWISILFLVCFGSVALAQTTPAICTKPKSLSDIQKRQRALGYSKARLTQWHTFQSPKSIILVIHGLNMRPDKMTAAIKMLQKTQASVLNITLEGHGENFKSFEAVTADQWLDNFRNSYCIAFLKAQSLQIPLYLFGYSTGATVALAAEKRDLSFVFDKRVLMSPALVMTWMSNTVRLLFPFEFINLPSSNLNDYRAHGSTPIPAYKALFSLADEIRDGPKKSLNRTPTIVLIDPNDELVSFKGIQTLVTKSNLDKWDVISVFTKNDKSKTRAPHHSLIDEYFTGPEVWKVLSEKTYRFLKPVLK